MELSAELLYTTQEGAKQVKGQTQAEQSRSPWQADSGLGRQPRAAPRAAPRNRQGGEATVTTRSGSERQSPREGKEGENAAPGEPALTVVISGAGRVP